MDHAVICACGAEFAPRKNRKTCSPECSAKRAALRCRAYHVNHPEKKRAAERRHAAIMKTVSHYRTRSNRLDRAVKILFALTH
jgi:hypothetical protein